jgi:hypothetical protein
MLLEKHDSLLHGLNLFKSAILDHLDITEVSHDLHEDFLLALGLAALRDHLDAVCDLVDELLDVVNLSDGVGEQERGVCLDPLANGLSELLNEREGVDTDPADIDGDLHLTDLLLDAVQVGHFLVEEVKVGFLGLHSGKDLVGHPLECLIFFLLAVLVDLHVNFFTRIITLFDERAEVLSKSLLPEELEILVLVDEVTGGILNLGQVVSHHLESAEELELVLDLNQVVTVTGVETWHLDGKGDEVVCYLHDYVTDTVASVAGLNRRLELDVAVTQVDLDVKHGWQLVVLVELNANLVREVAH